VKQDSWYVPVVTQEKPWRKEVGDPQQSIKKLQAQEEENPYAILDFVEGSSPKV